MVNTSFRAAPWADVLYACDASWWIQYFREVATQFPGEKWTTSAQARQRFDLRWIYSLDRPGLSRDPTFIHEGGNSGHQAIGLAALFGARRIVLLGFDFQRTNGKVHWHGDHPRGLGNGGTFSKWIAAMTPLARDLARANIEVINCTRKTALKCFPQKPIENVLVDIPPPASGLVAHTVEQPCES